MHRTTRFRTRLLLSFAVVIMLALLLPAYYARQLFRGEILDDAQAGAIRELRLAALLMQQHGGFNGEQALHTWLEDLGARLEARVTYITAGGRVAADSHMAYSQVPGMDNHAMRPEVLDAEQGDYGLSQRFSATLDKDMLYAAKRVQGVAGVPDGFLRLAVPYAGIRSRLERLQQNFLVVFGLALGMAFVLSLILARSMGRSIQEMIDVAEAIGQGDYNKRMRFFPGSEFEPLARAVNTMAGNINSQVSTITELALVQEAILDGMREGLMVLDGGGRILKVNRALVRIFPDATLFVGRRPLEIVLSPELQAACDRAVAGDLEAHGPQTIQIEPEKDRIYDVTIVPLNPGERGLGAIIVFHDISELKRLERVRRDFVANVSHELRTPLTTVKGYSETLLTNPKADGKTAQKFLEIILKNADHMAKMVEDLLHLSRLESGRQQFSPERVSAAEALAEALRTCEPLAQAKAIRLVSALPEGGVFVRADYDRLVQVFRNLVENAIKYGPEDSVVSVDWTLTPPGSQGAGEVVFGVSDFGPGIPKEEASRIFERFYRVEKHRGKNCGGSSGLGLAICKHIVERLGGRIWVAGRQDADTGSVFHFTMPADTTDGNGPA